MRKSIKRAFSENDEYRYQIVWNPKLWFPEFKTAK